MSYRIHRINKNSGITYVYEVKAHWDKDKKQARNKQVCIGKLDSLTGSFIPSQRLSPEKSAARDPHVTVSAEIIGPYIILNFFAKRLRLPNLLKTCFPNDYEQILTMSFYLASNGGALSHCESWCKSHSSPLKKPLTSQRISEICASINTDMKQTFLKKWMEKSFDNDYLCYDITSVSSYSKVNEYVKYGYNRDNEKLPQINLAMLFGQNSCLPVYYNRMPGNITDVTTLRNLLKTFKAMECPPINCVMDKGFYSKENINDLLESRIKFIIAVPSSRQWVQTVIDKIHSVIHGPQGYRKIDNEILYVHSETYPWGKNNRRCYLHLFYNAHLRAADIDRFNEELFGYRQELESGKTVVKHQKAYDTFFILKTTPKRGTKVFFNDKAVEKHIKRYSGFQAILSNSIKDPEKALQIYRDKDVVEKSFDDLQNQLDMKRLRMHSSDAVDGRLFIQFVSLILVSALRKEMRNTGLIKQYTVRELFREMECLTKIKYSGKYRDILTELTKQQKQILESLKIDPTTKT